MITRDFLKGDARSTAVYSDCERYRYLLTRIWTPDAPRALFVMLNPSTATEFVFHTQKRVLFFKNQLDGRRTQFCGMFS